MSFVTKLDYSNNRQIKQFDLTNTQLSGSTVFGAPFSALTGVLESSVVVTATLTGITSTFSGNSTTTNISFGDSRMISGSPTLFAITNSTSGDTQLGFGFNGIAPYQLDGNTLYGAYTGSTYDLSVTSIEEVGVDQWTGETISNVVSVLSGASDDFTGRTIWVDVLGILKTRRLIIEDELDINSGVTHGLARNSNGDVVSFPISGITGTTSVDNDYVTSAGFNTSDGVLTLTRLSGGTVTVDLDGRYLTTETDSQNLSFSASTGNLAISNGNIVNLDGRYSLTGHTHPNYITGASAPDTSIQFNNGGVFSGSSNLTWNGQYMEIIGNSSGPIYGALRIDTSAAGTGRSSPLNATYSDTSTNLTAGLSGIGIGNSNQTNNNYASVNYISQNTSSVGLVFGNMAVQFKNHATGSETADYVFNLRNGGGGAMSERMRIAGATGYITGNRFVTNGGTASQFVKGDGTLDSNTYLTGFTNTNDYVTGATFNTSNGILSLNRLSGGTVTVDLDDRYSLTGHTHGIGDITGFTDNSTNWNNAYDNTITGITVTGTTTKTITLSQQDGGLLQANFADTSLSGTSFFTVGSGLPNTNPSVNAYRTGKIGLNEPNPQELLDVVGTQSGLTGGVKMDYNWTGGEISRVQIGGQNLLSELGVPANLLKGNVIDYFGTGTFANRRAYFANGNFSVIDASLGAFSSSMGIANLLGTNYANINFIPDTAKGGDNFRIITRVLNASGDTASVGLRQYGLGSGTALEPAIENSIINSEGNRTDLIATPHYTSISNLMKLPNYGDGIFISGYTHTDTSGKTGTIATTISAATYGLAVDTNGNLMEIPLGVSNSNDYVTGATFNTSNGDLTLTRLSGGTVTVDLDNRYSLTGHTHGIGDITGFTDNSTQWNNAYDNTITGVTVTGTTTKTISLFQQDGGLLQANFVDNSGTSANDYVTGATFNTSDGVLTLTRLSGGTVTTNLDNRYSLTGHTHTFAEITSKPTTIAGYGIIDAVPTGRTITINGTSQDLSVNRTWLISSITGNSATATALQTARTINGTSFNGTANITTANWGTSRNLSIGGTSKAVNGSANVSWTTSEIGITKTNIDALNINADLLDGQHGSYYLDYNNFTNTPTISASTNDYVTGATFNTSNGDLTLTRLSGGTVTVDLDGRYLTGDYLPLSGGTLTGGLTGTTINIRKSLLDNQENLTVTTGTEVVATISKTTYDAGFFDYVVKNGTNLRAGTVMAVHDGTLVEFTDNSTNDLGDTSGVYFNVDISGSDLRLLVDVVSGTWEVKIFIRGL